MRALLDRTVARPRGDQGDDEQTHTYGSLVRGVSFANGWACWFVGVSKQAQDILGPKRTRRIRPPERIKSEHSAPKRDEMNPDVVQVG